MRTTVPGCSAHQSHQPDSRAEAGRHLYVVSDSPDSNELRALPSRVHRIGTLPHESSVRKTDLIPSSGPQVVITWFSSAQRGGTIRLNASASFENTLSRALARITGLINSKLDDFFGLSEYVWTPQTREAGPSMYLYELVNWLTTVVDSLVIKETYKDEAYKGAVEYIAECLMVCDQCDCCD